VSKDSILAILGNGLFTISTKDELSKPPPPILMALCQESVPHRDRNVLCASQPSLYAPVTEERPRRPDQNQPSQA
jgi:hypothetical protein